MDYLGWEDDVKDIGPVISFFNLRQNWLSWLAARNIMQVKIDFLSERIQARNSVEKLCIYLVVRLSSQLHVSVAVINLISFHLPSWLEWNCPTWCDWWRLASNVFPSQVSQPQWGWQWHRYQTGWSCGWQWQGRTRNGELSDRSSLLTVRLAALPPVTPH